MRLPCPDVTIPDELRGLPEPLGRAAAAAMAAWGCTAECALKLARSAMRSSAQEGRALGRPDEPLMWLDQYSVPEWFKLVSWEYARGIEQSRKRFRVVRGGVS